VRRLPNQPEYDGCEWHDVRLDYDPEEQTKVMLRLDLSMEEWFEVHSIEGSKFKLINFSLSYQGPLHRYDCGDFEELELAQSEAEEAHYEHWYELQDWCQCSDPGCPCTGYKVGIP